MIFIASCFIASNSSIIILLVSTLIYLSHYFHVAGYFLITLKYSENFPISRRGSYENMGSEEKCEVPLCNAETAGERFVEVLNEDVRDWYRPGYNEMMEESCISKMKLQIVTMKNVGE